MSLPTVPGQRYALVCIVPGLEDNPPVMSILGTFCDLQEAQAHVKVVTDACNKYDIYVCEVGKYLQVPPTPEYVGSVEYQDKYLNDLFTGYDKQKLDAQKHFEERKAHMIQNPEPVQPIPENLLEEAKKD
jgi:hypothetical protein